MRKRRSGVGLRLKGLRRFEQDGVRYTYHRATGTRLPDLPENHPDFLKAYMAAENGETTPKRTSARKGSIAAIWDAYRRSEAFLGLTPNYQRIINTHGQAIVDKGGKVAIASIRADHIRKDISPLKVNAARARLKAWSAICKFAIAEGNISDNPMLLVDRPRPNKPAKHKPWEPDHIAAFRKRWPHGSQQRVAFELLHWTGCRLSDVVRLGAGMVDRDGWLNFTQKKTGGAVSIPFDRDLPGFVDPADLGELHRAISALSSRHMTWITTQNGAARTEGGISNWFSEACRDAGMTGDNRRTGHGLRATRAVKLAENGATEHQIGAWTGHKSLSEITEYTRAASRKKLLSGGEKRTQIVQVNKS